MKKYLFNRIGNNFRVLLLIVILNVSRVFNSMLNIKILESILSGDLKTFLQLSGLMIGIWIIYALLSYVKSIVQANAIRLMNQDLREDILDIIVRLDYTDYYDKDTGSYVSWLSNDINTIENSGFSNFYNIADSVVTVITSLIGAVMVHYSFGIVFPVSVLLMIFLPNLFNKKIESASMEMSQEQERFISKIKDYFGGFELLDSFNLLNIFVTKVRSASVDVETRKYGLSKTIGGATAFLIILNVLSQMISTIISGILVIKEVISPGAILAIGNLSGLFFTGVLSGMSQQVELSTIRPIFEKFEAVRKQEPEGLPEIEKISTAIELKDIGYSYNEKRVLTDLNIKIQIGKKYAIVGDSGTGKTTVLRILMGQLKDYEGEICIDGKNVRDLNIDSIRNQIAYIDQNVYMFNDTIQYNITLDRNFTTEEMEKAIEESALKDFISNLRDGMETKIGEGGRNVSGGQRQRIAIARALLNGKNILFIDEGTSALDKSNAFEIESKLLNNPELTVIMISHNLDDRLLDKFNMIYKLESPLCDASPTGVIS